MPSKTKKQQKFFGLLAGIKKGTVKNASQEARKTAQKMPINQIKDFLKLKKSKKK